MIWKVWWSWGADISSPNHPQVNSQQCVSMHTKFQDNPLSRSLTQRNDNSENLTRVCVLSRFSHVQLLATLWAAACQAPLCMGFSRQEYWIGLPCTPPGDLPDWWIEPASLTSPALAGGFFTTCATWGSPWENLGQMPKVHLLLTCWASLAPSASWGCGELWGVVCSRDAAYALSSL